MERLQELMAAFHQAMQEEVEAMGGTVDSFVGDAVMAVFGVPAAHDDDPDRALTAARRMFDRMALLNATLFADEGVAVDLRVGVNTGDVVVAATGDPELGRITGDAVNVAARLHEHATPGTAIVAERTKVGASAFRFREIGPVALRGRSEPVVAFELGAPVDDGLRSSSMSAPMIGRDHELALLDTLYERVLRERAPHLVTVYGQPGVGKSRLAREFTESLARGTAPPIILRGRCRPYGEVAAYGALAEILKAGAGVLDADPPAPSLARVGKLVESLQVGTQPGDPDRIIEALAHTAGITAPESVLPDMSPRQIRTEIRGAWRWFFSASALQSPIVVLIEDIHWADPALLDLLEDLAERVDGPVMFLCPARPWLTDFRPNWGGGRHSFSSIMLDPLTPDDSDALFRLLTASDGIPEVMRSRILDRAEGNPFFLEEIIRSLVDAGSVSRTESGLRLVADVPDVQIPDTVHAVIAARLDLLGSDHKRALQCAAVIGRTFWIDLLSFLLGWEEVELVEALDNLERRDLVLARLSAGIGARREYRFRHALIRDVAYETLSRRDRTAIHRWVAEWLASASAGRGELEGLRAHHLTQAFDGMEHLNDEEAEQVRRAAVEALLAASTQAKRRVALGEAKHFAREARRIAVTKLEESSAVEAIGEAFFYGYEGDAAWHYLREAVDLRLASQDPDPAGVARMCARALEMPVRWPGAMTSAPSEKTVAHYLHLGTSQLQDPGGPDAVRLLTVKAFWQHAFPDTERDAEPHVIGPEEALRSAEQAVEAARRLGNAELESAALDGVSACYIPDGAYREALAAAQQRLDLLPQLHDVWEIGDMFAMNAWTRYHLGQYRETFTYADEGFTRAVGEAPGPALHCLRFRSQARFRLGEWPAAIEDYRLARRLLGEHADMPQHYVSPAFAAAALMQELRGEHAESDFILEMLRREHEATAPDDRDTLPLSRWAEFLAPILARRGRIEQARELLEATVWRRPGRLGLLLEAGIDVAVEAGDWDEAARLVEESHRLAALRRIESLEAAAQAGAGRVALAGGDRDQAVALLERAVTSFAGLSAEWDRARTELALAEAMVADGRRRDAEAVIVHALNTLERLGAVREAEAARDLAAP